MGVYMGWEWSCEGWNRAMKRNGSRFGIGSGLITFTLWTNTDPLAG
jgi:hypothetical protein